MTDGAFTKVRTNQLARLPIPSMLNLETSEIVNLVEQILTSKQRDPSVSTLDLEAAIDKLVYGLYDLTGEEITIIENSIK